MTDESNDLRSRMAEIEGKGATAPSDKPAEPEAKDEGNLRSRMADIEGKATSSGKRGSAAKSAGLAATAVAATIREQTRAQPATKRLGPIRCFITSSRKRQVYSLHRI